MTAHPGRSIDLEVLALENGLFDLLPPPKPLSGRAVDLRVLHLPNALFDTLPPPPPLQAMYDTLVPVADAELRGEPPALPAAPRRERSRAIATTIGALASLSLMALGVGLRHREPAATVTGAAPPRPMPTIELPEITIVGELRPSATPEVEPPAARKRSPRRAVPKPAVR